MLKTLTAKIFIGSALLLLISIAALSFIFAKMQTKEAETYALDSLLRKAQIETLKIVAELKEGRKTTEILELHRAEIFSVEAEFSDPDFSREYITNFLPPSGSVVTPCRSKSGDEFFCSFSYIPEAKAYTFFKVPRSSALRMVEQVKQQIFILSLVLLGVVLLLAFFTSRLLLSPLRNFALAASKVAAGDYDAVMLPIERNDEIGDFAHAFHKMIAELRAREARLAISAMKIAHSSRLAAIGQMGASIAHEVKNPLTSMLGYAKILQSQLNESELKEAADIIVSESERCNRILQQLLRFSRNDLEEKKPYSIHEVVESVLFLMKAEAKSRRIELCAQIDNAGIVVGSPQQIQQVLMNLILNALQASPSDSKVWVRCRERNGRIVLEVEDVGSGIPIEIQKKIFEPFFTTKESQEGTGLGLSVANEIILSQGGLLDFESQEGRGSMFRITLTAA